MFTHWSQLRVLKWNFGHDKAFHVRSVWCPGFQGTHALGECAGTMTCWGCRSMKVSSGTWIGRTGIFNRQYVLEHTPPLQMRFRNPPVVKGICARNMFFPKVLGTLQSWNPFFFVTTNIFSRHIRCNEFAKDMFVLYDENILIRTMSSHCMGTSRLTLSVLEAFPSASK